MLLAMTNMTWLAMTIRISLMEVISRLSLRAAGLIICHCEEKASPFVIARDEVPKQSH